LRCPFTPSERIEAKVEVPQHAADRHLRDVERHLREDLRFVLETLEACDGLRLEGADQDIRRAAALALVAPENQDIENPIGERMAAQRLPLRLAGTRKERP